MIRPGREIPENEPRARGESGQYFLRSPALADELVADANIDPSDHVLEIGAGSGRLTEALARRAKLVTALETDLASAEWLRATFADDPGVEIMHADALRFPPPRRAHRAFGNIPFGSTTAILRRLLDNPASHLVRADLLVQYDVARKRSAVWPSSLTSLGWLPWWRPTLARRIPRLAFEPVPAVDAGMLSVARRNPPLLAIEERPAFIALLRAAFRHGGPPIRRSLRSELPSGAWKRLARDRGIPLDARPAELDVFDWVAVFRLTRSAPATAGHPNR